MLPLHQFGQLLWECESKFSDLQNIKHKFWGPDLDPRLPHSGTTHCRLYMSKDHELITACLDPILGNGRGQPSRRTGSSMTYGTGFELDSHFEGVPNGYDQQQQILYRPKDTALAEAARSSTRKGPLQACHHAGSIPKH